MSFQKLLAFFASVLLLDLGSRPWSLGEGDRRRALGAAPSIKMRTHLWRE